MFLLIFLQKCCTVPKKPIFFCKSAVLFQKNKKNQSFPVLLPCEVPGPEKIVFLFFFFGTVQHFSKKDWFFWDSTVFLLIFLQKCCTVPKKPIFFCKSAVLFQKNQKKQSFPVLLPCEVPGPAKDCFFWFFGTVQHFSKKRLVFLGQYSVHFVNFLAKVLYCPKKTNLFLQKCCTVPKKPILWKACSR